ncbi:hypothetical protein JCM6882_006854 [Rhodosporidiobolus microsporus]
MSASKASPCMVCGKPSTQRCSGCGRWWFCGREHQKLVWPAHRIQCDRSLDHFRVPPLSEEEVSGLLKLAKGGQGYASYPFRHEKVDLKRMLELYGVERPEDVERHIRSVSGPNFLTLPETRLALLFRFFLRSYRYPPNSANLISMNLYRINDGTVHRTMDHMNAQALFPFCVKVPTGEDAFDPKNKSKSKPDPLVVARDYMDVFLVYSHLVGEHEAAKAAGKITHSMEVKTLFEVAGRRMRQEWDKLPKHRMLEESSPIGWHRGNFGQIEEKYFPEGYYLVVPDDRKGCVIS